MTYRILWPFVRWPDSREIEIESVGSEATAEFQESFEEVSDDQWVGCDALVCGPDVPREYRAKLAKCKIFVTPKVGFDNIDLRAWGELGIPVSNVPDYGTLEVADHAIALMLTLMKGIAFHTDRLRRHITSSWQPALNPYGRRLSACSFGVVGCGRIGTAAILRAKAFGMRCVFYDPYLPNGAELALGVERVHSLADLFTSSDVVSIHTPLYEDTRELIDAEVLSHSKQGLILINTARGGVIDLDALYDALKSGGVQAAGLDVLPTEPADADHPLIRAFTDEEDWLHHRLLLTPHSAFCTPESMRDMRFKGGEVAVTYLRGGRLQNVVNRAYLPPDF